MILSFIFASLTVARFFFFLPIPLRSLRYVWVCALLLLRTHTSPSLHPRPLAPDLSVRMSFSLAQRQSGPVGKYDEFVSPPLCVHALMDRDPSSRRPAPPPVFTPFCFRHRLPHTRRRANVREQCGVNSQGGSDE